LHLDDDPFTVFGLRQEVHLVVFVGLLKPVTLAFQQIKDDHRALEQGG